MLTQTIPLVGLAADSHRPSPSVLTCLQFIQERWLVPSIVEGLKKIGRTIELRSRQSRSLSAKERKALETMKDEARANGYSDAEIFLFIEEGREAVRK